MATLKDVREYQALTQRALAERAGVARLTIGNIERGKAPPIMSVRKKLAEALGVLPGEIDWPKAPIPNGKAAGSA